MKHHRFKENRRNLYFLAIVPGSPVQQEIMQFKEDARMMFQSSRSLNSPAHITIIPPFSLDIESEDKLATNIVSSIGQVKETYIELNGFGHFGKKVIFVDVEGNQIITNLNFKLKSSLQFFTGNDQIISNKFHPHITVAFKDLQTELFPVAWQYFSKIDYQRVIKIDSIELLRHENKMWKIVRSFKF